MTPWKLICTKELRNHFRDLRALASALLFPLLAAGLVAVIFSMMISWYRDDSGLEIAVSGAERAPQLIAFLKSHGTAIKAAPDNPASEVREGALDLALVIPTDYGDQFRSGHPAALRLIFDHSRNRTRASVQRARALLEAYSARVGRLRLLVRGVNPELARPLEVEEHNVASAQSTAANAVGMVPLFLLMAAFVGGMSVAVDATAGERERGELESLLLNPVPRTVLAAGKWAAAASVSLLSLLVALAAFTAVLRWVRLSEIGLRVVVGPTEAAVLLAILFPLSTATSALQLGLATYARSVKEAQAYLSMLMLVPTIPGLFLSLSPIRPAPWMSFVPILGQELLLNAVFRGEAVSPVALLVAGGVAIAVTAGGVVLTGALLRRERIIFGK